MGHCTSSCAHLHPHFLPFLIVELNVRLFFCDQKYNHAICQMLRTTGPGRKKMGGVGMKDNWTSATQY